MRIPAFLAALAVLVALALPASSLAVPTSVPDLASKTVTDGEVWATAKTGGRVYLGGRFNYIGGITGHIANVDATTGAADAVNHPRPVIDGFSVNAVVPDGAGGWYIGGEFTLPPAGVPPAARTNIAHILANGSIDTSFAVTINGTVEALALDAAHNRLFVGGSFTAVTNPPSPANNVQGLAAVHPATGAYDSTFDGITSGFAAYALHYDPATNWLYVGGDFLEVGGQARRHLARVAGNGNTPDPNWAPDVGGDPANTSVTTIALSADGTTLFLAGDFTGIEPHGSAIETIRRNAGAVLTATGAVTNFRPEPRYGGGQNLGGIQRLVATAHGVFAAGYFDEFHPGGYVSAASAVARYALARLDPVTGVPQAAWSPVVFDSVYGMTAGPDGTIYVTGEFVDIKGTTGNFVRRIRAAALSPVDATPTVWNPKLNASGRGLAVAGGRVLVGGAFISSGGQAQRNLAAVGAGSGNVVDSFNVDVDSDVSSLAVVGGGEELLVGGNFANVADNPRPGLARLNLPDGSLHSWAPQFSGGYQIRSLLVDGSRVIAAGDFEQVGVANVEGVAAIPLAGSGAADPGFNVGVIDGIVDALALRDGTLYVGGRFTGVGGQPRRQLAAVNAATGALVAGWDPLVGAATAEEDARVLSLAVSGSHVFAGGRFDSVDGQPAAALVRLDRAAGTVAARPEITTTGGSSYGSEYCNDSVTGTPRPCVRSLSLGPAGELYVGGRFDQIGGFARANVGVIGTPSGTPSVLGWNPGVETEAVVTHVSAIQERVFVGGQFWRIGDPIRERHNFASFGLTAPLNTALPAVTGLAHAGQTVTCATGAWTGDPESFAYQWLKNDFVIGGQNGTTYLIQAADAGSTLKCRVTATNIAGGSAPATSPPVAAGAAIAPVNQTKPSITSSGSFPTDQTLACDPGTWGGDPVSQPYEYEWRRDGNPVPNVPGELYTVQASDDGKAMTCVVTATNDGGEVTAESDPFGIGTPPSNTGVRPSISGTVEIGQQLTCSPGEWSGSQPMRFSYEWRREGVPIPEATAPTYTLTGQDGDRAIVCRVTAHNAPGSTFATSDGVSPKSPRPPVNVEAPRISGTTQPGNPVTCSSGVWGGEVPQTYSFQWLRTGQPIAGATDATRVLGPEDDGQLLTCRVTADNQFGSVNATSAPVGIGRGPTSTALPRIHGVARQGETLACEPGTFGGSVPQALSFRWVRDAKAVDGRTAATYPTSAEDVGAALVCEVTARNVVGHVTVRSAPVTVDLPPPTRGVTQNVYPVSGKLLLGRKGTSDITLTKPLQVPVGATIDATKGRMELETATEATRGRTQRAAFYDGRFKATQGKGNALTTLTLVGGCAKASSTGRATASAKRKARLWGNGKGRFRTRGKHSAAVVRGTVWLTEDSCAGTKTTVKSGVVAVTDFARKKTVLVKAGKSYTAKPKRRR